jgi:integrative and conjugative element protein (TIGR02256 family)
LKPIHTVCLREGSAELILQESERWAPRETGGVLIGRRDGNEVEVALATDAGPEAVHEPAYFRRDGEYAQHSLDAAALEFGGTYDYVGEWHSHPRSVGPSRRDRASMRWIARNLKYRCPHPLLLLCRAEGEAGWRIDGYCWTGGALSPLAVWIESGGE